MNLPNKNKNVHEYMGLHSRCHVLTHNNYLYVSLPYSFVTFILIVLMKALLILGEKMFSHEAVKV